MFTLEAIRNYVLLLRSSVQSFGRLYPLWDVVVVGVWLVCLGLTLLVIVGGIGTGTFSKAWGLAVMFGLVVVFFLPAVIITFRKFYIWSHLLLHHTVVRAKVVDVDQKYVYNMGAYTKNSLSFVTVEYSGQLLQTEFLNMNRFYIDLVGKEVLLKMSPTNPKFFRVISYADGSSIKPRVYMDYKWAYIITIAAIAFALIVGALNVLPALLAR